MKNFSGICQAAGADKPLRAFFIWITNIVTFTASMKLPEIILLPLQPDAGSISSNSGISISTARPFRRKRRATGAWTMRCSCSGRSSQTRAPLGNQTKS